MATYSNQSLNYCQHYKATSLPLSYLCSTNTCDLPLMLLTCFTYAISTKPPFYPSQSTLILSCKPTLLVVFNGWLFALQAWLALSSDRQVSCMAVIKLVCFYFLFLLFVFVFITGS